MKLIKLTPKMAEELLQRNTANFRPLSTRLAERYAEDMREGRWKFNGDTICFSSDDGVLIDGQHRLWAVVLSGKTIDVILVDVPSSSAMTKDVGCRRKTGDYLRHEGYDHVTTLASAARWVHAWRAKLIETQKDPNVPLLSIEECVRVVEQEPGLIGSVDWVCDAPVVLRRMLRPAIAAFLHYAFGHSSPVKRDAFFDLLAVGANLPPSAALHRLREKLTDPRYYGKALKSLPMFETVGVTIKAWNWYVVDPDAARGVLFWRRDEKMPIIL